MNLSHEAHILIYGLFFLMCFSVTAEEYEPCPSGFDLSYDERRNDFICFKLKTPETFVDKYVDCEENIYTLELHFQLNITRLSTVTFWIDYRSAYSGEPYVNVKNINDANVSHNTSHNNNESCLVVTNMDILTAVQCNEMHNRYCFVKSLLQNNKHNPQQDLQSLYNNSKNKCMLTITSTSNVTWIEAKSLCEDKEVSQINREWSYVNKTWKESENKVARYATSRNIEDVEELIDQIMHDLRQVFETDAEVAIQELDSIFDQVNYLMDLELDLAFPGELLRLLHDVGPRVSARFGGTAIRDNIGLNMMLSDGTYMSFVSGFIVRRHDRFVTDSFEIIYYYVSFPPESFSPTYSDVVVSIPDELVGRFPQNNYLVFRDDTFFHDSRGLYTVNSRVISIHHNTNSPPDDMIMTIYMRPLVEEENNMRRACVRWHFSEDGTGYWSEEGCLFIRSNHPEILDSCECYMIFTYYALAVTALPTVEDLIAQLLNDLRLLLEEGWYPVSETEHIFDQLNDLLELDENVVFPHELLDLLRELGKGALIDDLSYVTARNKIALLIASGQSAATGLTVARADDNIFNENTLNFLRDLLDDTFDATVNDAVLILPEAIWWYLFQSNYLVFQDDRVFYDGRGLYTIISRIISVNLQSSTEILNENSVIYKPISKILFLFERVYFADGLNISRLRWDPGEIKGTLQILQDHEIDVHLRPLTMEQDSTSSRTCVHWLYQDGTGYWTEEGCILVTSDDPGLLDTCRCKLFLTYYAMALLSEPVGETTATEETTAMEETTITDGTTLSDTTTITNHSTTEAITITPEEQIQQVLDDLHQLLNQTSPILVADVSQVFDQIDDLLNIEQGLDFPGEMLQLLEELGARVDLKESLTSAVVRNNIGLLMADVTEDNPVRGLVVASRDTDAFTLDAFEFLIGDLDSSLLNVNVSEAIVSLPLSVTRYPRRISFVAYHNARAFNYNREMYATNSRVLSISVGNHTRFERGEVVDIHLRPTITELNRDERRVCAYWHFLDNETGYWSQEGCRLIKSRDPWTLDTCRCDHLTHFAEVLFPRSVFSQLNEDILEILSIIGCFLSIFGIAIIILTAVLFRSWRKNFRNQIWLQLCIALCVMSVCFLIVAFSKYDEYSISCMLTGIGLHYSILASFCWMLVVAVKSYKDLVIVLIKQVPHKRLLTSGFSWGAPIVVIGILLAVNSQSYSGYFEETNPSSNFCYPSGTGLWVALYTPVVVMLLTNWILFILIIRKIGFAPKGPRSHKAGDNREALACLRLSIVLVFLFGLPWLFGLFSYNVVAAYFFTCTVTTQGFTLFLLVICGNTQTKNLWYSKLKRKQHKTFTVSSNFL